MENVLVTGASGGIGTALCVAFAQTGRSVAVHYRNNRQHAENLAKVLSDTYRVKTIAVQADVADRQSVNAMLDAVSAQLGDIDILVNNAGIAQQKLFTDLSVEDWHNMLGTNLDGVFNCTQEVLRRSMIKNHRGVILNISSMWGQVGASCEAHYSAAKAGVIGLTKALAKELGLSGIRVNCIAPGVIETEMIKDAPLDMILPTIPMQRAGKPEEIASAAVFLLSEGASYITRQVINVNGGII